MIRKLLIALILLVTFGQLNAQKVVLEREVDSVIVRPKFGPNQSYFVHGYTSYLGHWTTNGTHELNVVPFMSNKINLGIRAKKKLTRHTALIADVSVGFSNYRFTDAEGHLVETPNKIKEMARLYDVDLGAYARIGIGKRGDYIGRFVDLGYFLSQPFSTQYVVFTENPSGYKTRQLDPSSGYFIGNWQYGPRVHIGLNRYVFVFQYRLSDYFFTDDEMPQFPKFTAGFQIGFH